ncbi:MAG TPA: hypothetical protein VKR61_18105 [Bryobacteraceae bacterium]|nr:hypothetical protein [Bryobacteraceae bacterium]
MTSINLDNTTQQASAASPAVQPPLSRTPSPSTAVGQQAQDTVELSPAARELALTGRIAANEKAGNLSSDEAGQLYSQVSSVHSQIVSDEQANGGTLSAADAQAIQQLQTSLSQSVYTQAHGGTSPPPGATATLAGTRQAMEAGRIALNSKAGNLTGDQAQQLASQLGTIHQQIVTDKQADGGSLSQADAQAINQLESQLSQQIYQTAHPPSA